MPMPLDEIVLQELGLAPRWVRKEHAHTTTPATASVTGDEAKVTAVTPSQEQPRPPAAARPVMEAKPEPAALATARDEPFASVDETGASHSTALSSSASSSLSASAQESSSDDDVIPFDWDALAERVAACKRCRLCEKRTQAVFGVGDRAAGWLLVGEAPGENEDRLGEPFVGQAGKLLDNMLHALSLARGQNVYIANVIKCRPPGNRNPEPDEVARCEPYLQRQVALIKPKLIVAMGRFAAQSLLKTQASISSLRGRVHLYEGVPVIVTYHPAYLLRSLSDKSKAWVDWCLARKTWSAVAEKSGE